MKDVVRGLADILAEEGFDVTVYLPRYGFIESGEPLRTVRVKLAGKDRSLSVFTETVGGFTLRTLEAPEFSSKKDIYTYNEEDAPDPSLIGCGHRDVDSMNMLLQAGSAADMVAEGTPPDIIHGHDGHTGLMPLFINHAANGSGFFDRTGVLVTIHNAGLAYQQITGSPDDTAAFTSLSADDLSKGTLDGCVSPLLIAGLYGHLNTVSPGYSRELLRGIDRFSGDFGRILRGRRIPLPGIINGMDPSRWGRPEKRDSSRGQQKKEESRRKLREKLLSRHFSGIDILGDLPDPDRPWVLFHGRLTHQKGIDDVMALPDTVCAEECGCRIIIYGRGDPMTEDRLAGEVNRRNGWTFLCGYDAGLTAELIEASSFVMVPSEWEPCGQIDMAGQLLGALPIVRSVGGLKKVRNRLDGFRYSAAKHDGLTESLERALRWEKKRPAKVSRMRKRAENVIYGRRSWRKVAVQGYLPLYRKARRRIRHT